MGCGPGGAQYLTGQALAAVREADTVLGPPRLLALFEPLARSVVLETARAEEVAALIRTLPAERLAVLVSGDPGLFSLAGPLRRLLAPGWQVRAVPGISSLQAACACLGLEWQHMQVFSAHRATPAQLAAAVESGASDLAVLCGPGRQPQHLAAELLKTTRGDRRCHVASDLGEPTQRLWSGTLRRLAQEDFVARSVLIVERRQS
ncbi:MAG: precorrin-6y C5,15-methyltransferase (decarboxylating) subunit CbiE [Syntrophomonadaceae bacterium]|nr:precorrin-6y C5,15-methyltransferase (decarboxylating) subunit CbiE [Syntrophomonadaceae bacterium]MDH7497204.1 precorrin-6y C5,15-methyltransferase (decarboxylating) subunit CbiE [Syntrophomonadaceae bacterium]